MKMFRNYLFIAAAIMSLAACDDDDDEPGQVTEEKDGIIASQDDPDLVVGDLRGRITGDVTLAAAEDWILAGPLVVEEGGKLTIEKGTTIKAQAGGTNVYIAIERNGQIQAVGTAQDPITITSNAATPEAGDWGGLLIMGNASITGEGTAVTEVVDFIYGNGPDSDDEDDSGDISYLILEYTGARINGEKEFNGLTLYGVGSGTSISNVAIFYGDDDAIEWFGGTVDVSNLLVVNATDDMFDWTQGWRGTGENFYGIREASYTKVSGDPRGIEGDGNLDGLTPSLDPQSSPTIENLTIVNNAEVELSDVIKVRRGSGAIINNARVVFGDAALAPGDFVDLTDGNGDAAASTTITISGMGTNLNQEDNKAGANAATITVEETTGVSDPASLFGWTGYGF